MDGVGGFLCGGGDIRILVTGSILRSLRLVFLIPLCSVVEKEGWWFRL